MENNEREGRSEYSFSEDYGYNSTFSGNQTNYAQGDTGVNKKKKSKKGVIILIGFLIALLFVLWLIGSTADSGTTGDAASGPPENYGEYIARVNVIGTISSSYDIYGSTYNHQFILNTIENAMYDPSNVGIFLYLNTPGGGVYESDEVYLALKEYSDTTDRPIYAYMGNTAASGGYYIAMGADKVYANRNTITGSIGVIMGPIYDVSEFLSNHGIKTKTFASGENKAMGSITDPLTVEQEEIYMSVINEMYGRFVNIIANERGLEETYVRELADGRIYTANQALENQLIDGIMTVEEAMDVMKEENGLGNVAVYEYKQETTTLLDRILKSTANLEDVFKSDLTKVMEAVDSQELSPMYLMK